MRRKLAAMDIDGVPELVRLVEEVCATRHAYVLRRDNKDIARVTPVRHGARSPGGKTDEDLEALRSSFGGWKGIVDVGRLKRDLAAARGSRRPPIEL